MSYLCACLKLQTKWSCSTGGENRISMLDNHDDILAPITKWEVYTCTLNHCSFTLFSFYLDGIVCVCLRCVNVQVVFIFACLCVCVRVAWMECVCLCISKQVARMSADNQYIDTWHGMYIKYSWIPTRRWFLCVEILHHKNWKLHHC